MLQCISEISYKFIIIGNVAYVPSTVDLAEIERSYHVNIIQDGIRIPTRKQAMKRSMAMLMPRKLGFLARWRMPTQAEKVIGRIPIAGHGW